MFSKRHDSDNVCACVRDRNGKGKREREQEPFGYKHKLLAPMMPVQHIQSNSLHPRQSSQ